MAQQESHRRVGPVGMVLGLALGVAVLLGGTPAAASTDGSAPTPAVPPAALKGIPLPLVSALSPEGGAAAARGYLETVNSFRSSQGVRPLRMSAPLSRLARHHSREMAREHRVRHSDDLAGLIGGGTRFAGENVGTGASVQQVHEAFLQSPGHLGALLWEPWRRTGIGVYERGGRVWVTQIFAD